MHGGRTGCGERNNATAARHSTPAHAGRALVLHGNAALSAMKTRPCADSWCCAYSACPAAPTWRHRMLQKHEASSLSRRTRTMASSITPSGIPPSDSDPIGPHDDNPPSRGKLERGGTPDSAPLNFDDDEIYSGRGKKRDGGTTQAAGGDSGKLGPPAEQLSDTNAPSDPSNRKGSA
jgi:hypothetical protein